MVDESGHHGEDCGAGGLRGGEVEDGGGGPGQAALSPGRGRRPAPVQGGKLSRPDVRGESAIKVPCLTCIITN